MTFLVFGMVLGGVRGWGQARTWNNAAGGNWNTSGNWTPGGGSAVPNTAAESAVFGSVGGAAIAQNAGNITIGQIVFSNATVTRTITGSQITLSPGSFGNVGITNYSGNQQNLNLPLVVGAAQNWGSSSGLLSIGGTVAVNNALTVDGAGDVSISGVISGSAGITKLGTGKLSLSGNNATWSGTLSVNAGVVNLQANSTVLGTTALTTVASGAALELQGGISIASEPLSTLNGGGIGGAGALRNISGNNTWNGAITLGSATTIGSDAGMLTLGGTLSQGAALALTYTGAGTNNQTGAITGGGSVSMTGSGVLKLGNAGNTFTNLAISSGTVQLGVANAIPNSTPVTLTGGTLDLNGFSDTIGALNISAGAVTTGAGTLTLGGDVTAAVVSGTPTISGNLALGATRIFNVANGSAAVDLQVGANISGATFGITKIGLGTLQLSGANTYSGPTTVSAGVIDMASYQGLGTGALSIGSGAEVTASFVSGTTATLGNITLAGGTLRRTANSATPSVFQNSGNTFSVTSSSILKDDGNTAGGSLEIDGVLSVASGVTLTANALNANSKVAFGSTGSINLAPGATIATTGSGTVAFGVGSGRQVVAQGTDVSESTISLGATTTANVNNSLVINGSGLGGLRVEGTQARVDSLVTSSLVNNLSGSGGTLTVAYTDPGSYTAWTAAPSAGTSVKLGFDGAGSYDLGTFANQLANWGGLVVKGGTVTATANQTFNGVAGSSTFNITGGSLGFAGTTLKFFGTATLTGGSIDGNVGGGSQGTLYIQEGHLHSYGTTLNNAPNITMDVAAATYLVDGSTPLSGIGNFTKNGSGTVRLDQSISVIAGKLISVNSGTLLLGASDRIGDSSAMKLAGGTFATGGNSETLGTLTLSANSTIDLGSGASILSFGDSSARTWTGGTTLVINNWSGSLTGGGTDQIYFGSNSNSLTSAQLAQIVFHDPFGPGSGDIPAIFLPSGEIVPIPEPGTVIAGFALVGMLTWSERRALRGWVQRLRTRLV